MNKEFCSILESKDGFLVTFGFEGNLMSGIVSKIPDNYEELTIEEMIPCFKEWGDEILSKLDNNLIQDIGIKKKSETFYKEIVNTELFTVKNDCYYRLNNNVSIPKEILNAYIKNKSNPEKIAALDNFWNWTMKNEYNVREMLYSWLANDSWDVTNEGMIITYRNVKKVNEVFNIDFNTFVNKSYNKVKRWKKNPKNHYINNNNPLTLTTQPTSFNLLETYNKLKNPVQVYSHSYNTKNKHYYYLNQEAVIARSLCDTSNQTCSSGFHQMSKKFLELNGKSYFGDGTTLCCLVNPAMIVSCPTENGYNKMRTCAFYPVCEVTWEDDLIVLPNKDVIENASKQYKKLSDFEFNEYYNNDTDLNPKFIGINKFNLKERIVINI